MIKLKAHNNPMTDSEILGNVGSFSEADVELFKTYRHIRFFRKKDRLLREGEICHSLYYLKKGAIVQYKQIDQTERQYTNLHVGGEWLFNFKSVMSQSPADGTIEAFADCEVVEISLQAIYKLIEKSSSFLLLNRAFNSLANRVEFFDENSTPAIKYETLIRKHPQLIKIFPLKVIASYLKISPETLSRVRSNG